MFTTRRLTFGLLGTVLALGLGAAAVADDARPPGAAIDQVVLASVVLGADRDSVVALGGDEVLGRFRRWVYDEVGNLPNHRIRAEFYARYPSPTDFDARAFKELLMLDSEARVVGVDHVGRSPRSLAVREVVRIGAEGAAEDGRARDRLFRARDGSPILDGRGDPVPFDPLVLNVGPARGPHSDAHAWLSVRRGASAADTNLLERRPWEVALPLVVGDSVASFASEHVQIYTDLAVLATLWEEDAALPYIYAGSALSYLASAGTPVHTLQLGTAALHRGQRGGWWRRIRTLFGLLERDELPGAEGLERVANYRAFGRAIVEARTPPADADAGLAGGPGGGASAQATGQRWAASLTRSLADASRRPGAESFDLLARLANADLGDADPGELEALSAAEIVSRFLAGPEAERTEARVERYLQIQDEAMTRTASAGRTWWRRFESEATPADADAETRVRERVLTRLVARQLSYLSEAEVRRARYMMTRGAARD